MLVIGKVPNDFFNLTESEFDYCKVFVFILEIAFFHFQSVKCIFVDCCASD